MDKTRELALKVLYKIEKDNAYSNIILDETIKNNRNKIDNRDIGLMSELVYGVTSWRLTLDEIIKKHSKIKIKKISPWILNILRMGIYQIIFLDRIPKSAAVNESVKLAKKYGHNGSSSFTNAILRKINEKDYKDLFNIEDTAKRISLTTSMPLWIVEKLLKQKGEKTARKICYNSNVRPKIAIRINNIKTSKDEIIKELNQKEIEFEETESKDFLILKNQKNIDEWNLFKEGKIFVQDLSAGLVARTLNPKEYDKILDACSAPGGKTTYLAELMKNHGNIEAWDIYEHRLNLIKENAKRLGIDIINTKIHDATNYDSELTEKFDKILLDVPCLGLGVIKRKPDIKWQRKPEDIEKISKIQFKILDTCSKYLKHGGELVYSTCSILKEENEDIIEMFLNKANNFEKIESVNVETDENHDVFFICKILKK